jgi:hypothetical protein
MGDVNSLTNQLAWAKKRTSFAWAKYYESVNTRLNADYRHYNTIITSTNADIPQHIKDELITMSSELKKQWECPVCMEMIKPETLDITNCGHYFCKPCLVALKARSVGGDCKCPICRRGIKTD